MAKQDFSFFHTLRVRWSEVDMQASAHAACALV